MNQLGLVAYVDELGRRVEQERMRQGLSHEEAAARAGVATYTYLKVERGRSASGQRVNPNLYVLLAIAGAFGIDLRDLLPPAPSATTR
ncbi:helix-turn-helix domain-containing protein [Pimelobacter sp. 30-1]|uniref:helix-turn-helix domain-containing protein n=1 Tax=Pimelobacter sp. 30-1 TaxID=2004991 RepID=UPI001C03A7CF|nr:helix-turn-helix transcriptional regulator [Pimelobacter sp. 30-1]MBU2696998.1 hypothetical protein [Pimelobacter sp. 30-1]